MAGYGFSWRSPDPGDVPSGWRRRSPGVLSDIAGGGPSVAPDGGSQNLTAELLKSLTGQSAAPATNSAGVYQGGPRYPAKAAAGASSGAAAGAGEGQNNSVAANPVSNGVIDMMLDRAKGDMGAGAALDRGIQKIRANASQGIGKEMAASRAARGVSGGGLDDADARGLAQMQEGQIGSLTTDILLGRERDRDALMANAGNMGLAQGNQQQNQQQINFAQYNANRDAAFRESNAQQNNLMSILSLLGGSSLFSGNSLGV